MAQRGRFITFEGGEGSGKSTQVGLLSQYLRDQGREVVETREPGGCPGAEEIRALLVSGETGRWEPMSEALLHFAARRQHLVEVVWPALEAGRWVVSDRFADSTLAYQGYGQGLDPKAIEALYDLTVGQGGPDLTLILDLPVEQGLARAEQTQRYERMGLAFHQRLREGFLEIAKQAPERCRVIDGTGDVEQVQAAVLAALEAKFP